MRMCRAGRRPADALEIVGAAKITRSERPVIGDKNVRSLELVEFFLCGEVGNEIGLFFGRQRCIAVSVAKMVICVCAFS